MVRIMRLLLCIGISFAFIGCHDHDHGEFSTFQACYDEHVVEESLPFQEAVVVCCLDHPVNGNAMPCGATAPECVTYLTANLTSTATTTEVEAACDEYVIQKGM